MDFNFETISAMIIAALVGYGLGMLFKSQSSSNARTEMVIYLVPHWEVDSTTEDDSIQEKWTVNRVINELIPEALDEK